MVHAKVIGMNANGPRSYDITTPQGQHYRRNRKDLRNLVSPVYNDSSADDFIDDQEFGYDTNEPVNESPEICETLHQLQYHDAHKEIPKPQ